MQTLLDVELSSGCRYYQKTEDFHKFVGPDHTVYGFGFHPSAEGLAQAKKFLQLVRKALDPDMNSLNLTDTLPSMTPSSHRYSSVSFMVLLLTVLLVAF